MRKPVRALVLAGLVLLAGCNGVVDAPASDTAETTTVPTTEHETTTSSTGPSTTVDPSQVVAFDELNAQQRAAFRDALQGGATFVPDSPHIDDSAGHEMSNVTPFELDEYVRYDGELYEISLGMGRAYASHIVMAGAASPPENATVVAFENVSANASDVLRTALTDGRYESGVGRWPDGLPGRLGTLQYVRYQNQTYELTYAIGDAWAKVLTVEKVE